MSGALSKTGERRLAAAEAKIEQGLATFMEVGEALVSIRDERLYRAEHDTFEAYCKSRWGFTDRRARQLIDAAQIGTVVPVSNEAQARAFVPVKDDPEAMQDAFAQAEADGDTTAAGLTRAVKRRKATTTSTTETVTFDPPVDVNGEIIAGGGAAASGDSGRTPDVQPAPSPVPTSVTCPTCGGACATCGGTGWVTAEAS